jgi:hypothetical protein
MILIQEKLCTHLFSFRKTFCEVSAAGILDWLSGPAVACQAVPKKFQSVLPTTIKCLKLRIMKLLK